MFSFLLQFLVSHVLHYLLIYILRLFMIHVFYFLFCEIKNLCFFTCIFYTCFMCLLSVSGIYRFVQSCCCLHWQLIDSCQVELFNGLFCNFEHFNFVMCFVTDFQRGSLLGSKTLGSKCIKTSTCNVLANHNQNIKSRFRLLKVCLCVKLESSNCRKLPFNFGKA